MFVKGHFYVEASELKETLSKIIGYCCLHDCKFEVLDIPDSEGCSCCVSFNYSDRAFSSLKSENSSEFVYYWTDFVTSVMRFYDIKIWFDCLVGGNID